MNAGGVRPVSIISGAGDTSGEDHSGEEGLNSADKLGYTRRSRDAWCLDDLAVVPAHLRPGEEETLDLILRRKVFLLQSRRGYRANTDSWVLAYAAWSNLGLPTSDTLTVTDLGAGHGLASIIFGLRSQRTSSLHLVEFQEQLAARACRNMELNGISGYDVRVHDLQHELPVDLRGIADVVLCNPPFYEFSSRLPPKMMEKRLAHFETSAGITQFMKAARNAVRSTGSIFVIYDILNVEKLMRACGEAGLVVSFAQEVMHREGSSTGRVVIRAKLGNDGRPGSVLWRDHMTLHSPKHEEPLYRPEIEAYFAALPSLVLDIGRMEYVGCPEPSKHAS